MNFQSTNPHDGKSVATFQTLSESAVRDKIDSAADAFRFWHRSKIDDRGDFVRQVADRLDANRAAHARMITEEMGKPIAQAESEIDFCAQIMRYYADHAATFLAPTPMDADDVDAVVVPEPIGVILGIMPWNFPFYQVIRLVAPNLMAGNTVLIKHAANVPRCALGIEKLFAAATTDHGLPAGLVQNLFIDNDAIERVIGHHAVAGVSLTGSNRAGAAVAAIAGRHVKPTVLELGGDDPFVVCDDVDLESLVPVAVDARVVNTGQSCIAAKRFIVARSIHDAFVDRVADQMSKLRVGDPTNRSHSIGPMCTAAARDRLAEQVDASRRSGTQVITGGRRIDGPGFYYPPTVLADLADDDPSADEELFGPVAKIIPFDTDDDAIAIANSSPFGLGGSVHSGDVHRAGRIAAGVRGGMVFVNAPCKSRCDLPFGGTKASGYGRELGPPAIRQFVNPKLIVRPVDAAYRRRVDAEN